MLKVKKEILKTKRLLADNLKNNDRGDCRSDNGFQLMQLLLEDILQHLASSFSSFEFHSTQEAASRTICNDLTMIKVLR